MRHRHEHGHAGHRHELRALTRRRLWIALAVNAVFLVVEIVGGILTNSLALLADAGHMLTDVAALVLAIVVAHLAERPPSPRHTFGLLRAEVLGAFANGAFLVLIVGFVFIEAWRRIGATLEVNALPMIVVALFGLGANVVSAWVLYGSRNENVNLQGAYLHMFGDALGSVGAVTAGIVILVTGRTVVDPLISLGIGLVILWSSLGLIRRTIAILLEATPEGIDYDEIKNALLAIDHVTDVRDLHIWTISSDIPALSAHVSLETECSDSPHWQVCLRRTQDLLRERFGIVHTTLQFEPPDYERDDRPV